MSEVPVPRGSTAITEKPSDNRCGMIARHVYQVCGQPPIRRRAGPLPPATACKFTLPAASICDVKCSARLSGNLTRSEEHTSELQSLMRNSYAVFCLKKKNQRTITNKTDTVHKN